MGRGPFNEAEHPYFRYWFVDMKRAVIGSGIYLNDVLHRVSFLGASSPKPEDWRLGSLSTFF